MSLPELHGHGAVWQRLTALIAADRLPHALLLSGAPGIGKASLALRLAAFLACTAQTARPCAACPGCRQVIAGSHPDLMSIAAPSRKKDARKKEIGVDQARELKRFVQLQAVVAARKMAIIDDADRLSIAAQNALLKTLEEPPGRALLMLITAAPGALLTTVRSRCQRLLMQPLAPPELRAALAAQGLAADEIERLAGEADGSPGRALALRETWTSAEQETLRSLLADLQGGRYGSVLAMAKALGKTDAETAARLEGLLAHCHAEALAAARAGGRDALDRANRRAAAVADALRALRWSNANRALLTEALALRLAQV